MDFKTLDEIFEYIFLLIPDIFKEIIDTYDFKVKANRENRFVTLSSNKCVVTIYQDLNHIGAVLEPIITANSNRFLKKAFNVEYVVRALNDNVNNSVFPPIVPINIKINKKEIFLMVQQIAELLLTYCSDILKGDFSQWHRVEEYFNRTEGPWLKKIKEWNKNKNETL